MFPKALVLIDFEKEWIDKTSEYYVGDISPTIKRVNQLIDFCRKKGYKIIFTVHIGGDSDKAFAPHSKNVQLIDSLHQKPKDIRIEKNKISPFFKTTLDKELKDTKQIVTCGILTNLCVRSFVQDTYDRDFDITIIKNCCVSFDKQTQDFTFKDLKTTREEIKFLNLKEFIAG